MKNKRLLVADDSQTIQKLITLTFADEGYDVVTVGDGDSALSEIGANIPDIVLADVNMPGTNGYDICALMRDTEETQNVPVILLVGSFEPFDQERAEKVGSNAYVTKPFQSIRALVEQVDGLLADRKEDDRPDSESDVSQPAHDEVPDTTDIDSLYEKSFAETVEMPAELAAELYQSSDRLDDQMIQTSYLGPEDIAGAQAGDLAVEFGNDDTFDNGQEEPIGESSPETVEQYSDTDGSRHSADTVEMPASEDRDSRDDFRQRATDPFATTADDFDFDELDLLNLTPATMSETLEFTTPPLAAEQGGKSRVVSLSPELLDIIVQRVVEKLSEKY